MDYADNGTASSALAFSVSPISERFASSGTQPPQTRLVAADLQVLQLSALQPGIGVRELESQGRNALRAHAVTSSSRWHEDHCARRLSYLQIRCHSCFDNDCVC